MPKLRQTCTRCSQRRQKCDRKAPCTRCVQSGEGQLCTTKWVHGYDSAVHRKYPKKASSPVVQQSAAAAAATATSSSRPGSLSANNTTSTHTSNNPTDPATGQDRPLQLQTPSTARDPSPEIAVWPASLPEITIGALLSDKDQQVQQNLFNERFEHTSASASSKNALRDGPTTAATTTTFTNAIPFLTPAARTVQIRHAQLLLPSKAKVVRIVEYYENYMLYWNAGLYHGPSFRKKLLDAYGFSDTLDLARLDWQWTALLFSILSSAIIGCSEAVSHSWGFTIDDKVRLSREWGAAVISCLNLGDYMCHYQISAVQAIYIMHSYEHLVGSTNQWAILKNAAVAIARGLGLHRLGPHPDDDRVFELEGERKQEWVEREIGRRMWYVLASQDWLCATSQTNYVSGISNRFLTSRPKMLDEESMTPVACSTPSFSLVGLHVFDYAALLLEFHNAMVDAEGEDDSTRYTRVLKFDGEMRASYAEKSPKCLAPQARSSASNRNQPKWAPWAWRLHHASVNHKIIMIHQNFLNKSFKDTRYTYSRWACATAAKNIIDLYQTRDVEEPQWWVEQAFLVTAGVCLCLDLFHRTEKNDAEAQDYHTCVHRAIRFLQQYFTSSVALHGTRLLYSLLQEYTKMLESPGADAGDVEDIANVSAPVPPAPPITQIPNANPDQGFPTQPLSSHPEFPSLQDESAPFNIDMDGLGFENLMDYLPAEGGLDNTVFFDSLWGVATNGN